MNMSKDEIISAIVTKLDALDGDAERSHAEADKLMQEAFRLLGAKEVADAFERASERVGFWYA